MIAPPLMGGIINIEDIQGVQAKYSTTALAH